MLQQKSSFEQLCDMVKDAGEYTAAAIYRHIRSGRPADTILRLFQIGSTAQPVRIYEQRLRRQFILTLVQCDLTLKNVVDIASYVMNPEMRINLPGGDAYVGLRDRIITLETLAGVLQDANPEKQGLIMLSDGQKHPNDDEAMVEPDGPTFWVPASPWTSLTVNDEAISHLVSHYLTLVNPFWYCVEENIFLKAMRGRKQNEYCSPALGYAIAAVASVSEIGSVSIAR